MSGIREFINSNTTTIWHVIIEVGFAFFIMAVILIRTQKWLNKKVKKGVYTQDRADWINAIFAGLLLIVFLTVIIWLTKGNN